jgi:hypothetical protein
MSAWPVVLIGTLLGGLVWRAGRSFVGSDNMMESGFGFAWTSEQPGRLCVWRGPVRDGGTVICGQVCGGRTKEEGVGGKGYPGRSG